MVAMNVSLFDIPDNFARNFLKDSKLSSRSRREGMKLYCEGYAHSVTDTRQSAQTVTIDAKCYHNMRKSEKHTGHRDIDGELYLDTTESLLRCP